MFHSIAVKSASFQMRHIQNKNYFLSLLCALNSCAQLIHNLWRVDKLSSELNGLDFVNTRGPGLFVNFRVFICFLRRKERENVVLCVVLFLSIHHIFMWLSSIIILITPAPGTFQILSIRPNLLIYGVLVIDQKISKCSIHSFSLTSSAM